MTNLLSLCAFRSIAAHAVISISTAILLLHFKLVNVLHEYAERQYWQCFLAVRRIAARTFREISALAH